jgi:hypothetical protein
MESAPQQEHFGDYDDILMMREARGRGKSLVVAR